MGDHDALHVAERTSPKWPTIRTHFRAYGRKGQRDRSVAVVSHAPSEGGIRTRSHYETGAGTYPVTTIFCRAEAGEEPLARVVGQPLDRVRRRGAHVRGDDRERVHDELLLAVRDDPGRRHRRPVDHRARARLGRAVDEVHADRQVQPRVGGQRAGGCRRVADGAGPQPRRKPQVIGVSFGPCGVPVVRRLERRFSGRHAHPLDVRIRGGRDHEGRRVEGDRAAGEPARCASTPAAMGRSRA